MRLSLKQKQVLGVTLMVTLIVIALSLLHLVNTAGVLLAESRDRFELFGSSVYSQAAAAIVTPETAYQDVRSSKYVQSALESALYSQDTLDASIVDPTGVVIASSDPMQVGKTVSARTPPNRRLTCAAARMGSAAKALPPYARRSRTPCNATLALPSGSMRPACPTIG